MNYLSMYLIYRITSNNDAKLLLSITSVVHEIVMSKNKYEISHTNYVSIVHGKIVTTLNDIKYFYSFI